MLGKRSYGSYEPKKFKAGSGSRSYKRPAFEKTPIFGQGQNQGPAQAQAGGTASGPTDRPGVNTRAKCSRCMGPHPLHECK